MNGLLATLNREVGEYYGEPVKPRLRRAPKKRHPSYGKPRKLPDPERDAHMVALRHAGHTLDEIGAAHGITRERARQILERNGVTSKKERRSTSLDPIAVLRFARSREADSIRSVARRFRTNAEIVSKLLDALGVREAVKRLYRMRSPSGRDVSLARLRAFIGREGRLPYARELGTVTGTPRRPDLPSAPSIIQQFGSLPAAWAALGYESRAKGSPGHRTPRQIATHCRRGHEFTPENTYTYKPGIRFCRACKKLRGHA